MRKTTTISSQAPTADSSKTRRVPITLAPEFDRTTQSTTISSVRKKEKLGSHQIVNTFLSSSIATNNIMDTSEAPVTIGHSESNGLNTSTTTATTTSTTSTTTRQRLSFPQPNFKENYGPSKSVVNTADRAISPPPGAGYCKPNVKASSPRFDELNWSWARPGTVAVMPCPRGASGMARWECRASDGKFIGSSPDLSQCRSMWLKRLYERLQNDNQRESIVLLANELLHHLVSQFLKKLKQFHK